MTVEARLRLSNIGAFLVVVVAVGGDSSSSRLFCWRLRSCG